MLRRTKESQNDDGSPLLKLPPRYVKEILCDFDADERKFYDAIHNRAEQEISKYVALHPGDIIATGTPAGVGAGLQPPKFLQPGDEVKVTIDNIGTLTTYIAK